MRLHREPTSLSDIWRRVWNDLTSQRQGRKAQIIESKDSCECLVSIDVMRLEQVFRNLFENSLAACSDPVCIHLKCLCNEPDFVLLDIQDNGPGVCIKLREKLFEPFYTTRSRGTGLGLSIIQRIIDVHGGDIHVVDPNFPESNPRGARFKIRLPKYLAATRNSCHQHRATANV